MSVKLKCCLFKISKKKKIIKGKLMLVCEKKMLLK